MTSPDERFDDVYGDERLSLGDPSRGLAQWIPNDDSWFEQQYEDMFLAEHGHQAGIPCTPETCKKSEAPDDDS